MLKKLLLILSICLSAALMLQLTSCGKPDTTSSTLPAPPPSGGDDNGNGNNNGNGNDNGNGNENPPVEDDTHCTDIGQTPIVLAYYTENSPKLPDVTLLTHINYAHGRFNDPTNGSGGIWIDKPDLMQKVIALKSKNPNLKVMLMIGGWGMKADGFSMMARDAAKRTEFCQSIKEHLDKYGLDGVDIDWEYPGVSAEGTGYDKTNDKPNFNKVLKELRETIGTSKIISFASSASHPEYVDWSVAIKYMDYVNVMTYDMGRAPDKHNSPLHRSAIFNQTSCDESIKLHQNAGIPKERLVLGVPFYGKSDKNDNTYADEVKYNEMDEILNKGTYNGKSVAGKNIRRWDATAMVPYLVDEAGKNLLSYDDPESVAAKGAYAVGQGLLGAMFWEYRHDDDNQSLLKSLVNAMYGKESVLE